MNTVTETIFCPAKINLFLEVGATRSDGYHNIDTVMQTVDLCDVVSLTFSEGSGRVTLSCTDKSLADPEHNIASRAAGKYLEASSIENIDVHINIEKNIPVAAGLAGGSTDAAGVLLLMEKHFDALDRDRLLELGGSLGADVPFCMIGGAARAVGIGDVLTPVKPLSREMAIVIAKSGEGVSTKEAYGSVPCGEKSSDNMVSMLESGDIFGICSGVYNAFEQVVMRTRPAVCVAKELMLEYGALCTQMSGSGPSVFGIFSDHDLAERSSDKLAELGYSSFVTFACV